MAYIKEPQIDCDRFDRHQERRPLSVADAKPHDIQGPRATKSSLSNLVKHKAILYTRTRSAGTKMTRHDRERLCFLLLAAQFLFMYIAILTGNCGKKSLMSVNRLTTCC